MLYKIILDYIFYTLIHLIIYSLPNVHFTQFLLISEEENYSPIDNHIVHFQLSCNSLH